MQCESGKDLDFGPLTERHLYSGLEEPSACQSLSYDRVTEEWAVKG